MSDRLSFDENLLAIECAEKVLSHLKRHQNDDILKSRYSRHTKNIKLIEGIIHVHRTNILNSGRQAG